MDIIAGLLVVTLVGLIVAIGTIIAVALSFRKLPARVTAMTENTKNKAVELVNTGKGIAEVGKLRYTGYVKHGTRIYTAVKETSDQVGTAAKSVDVDQARSTIKNAAAAMSAAQEGLAAAKAMLDLIANTQKNK